MSIWDISQKLLWEESTEAPRWENAWRAPTNCLPPKALETHREVSAWTKGFFEPPELIPVWMEAATSRNGGLLPGPCPPSEHGGLCLWASWRPHVAERSPGWGNTLSGMPVQRNILSLQKKWDLVRRRQTLRTWFYLEEVWHAWPRIVWLHLRELLREANS